MDFDHCTHGDAEAMTSVIVDHGWEQVESAMGSTCTRDPCDLKGAKNVDACRFEITTVNISRYLPGIEDTTRVPEPDAFTSRP